MHRFEYLRPGSVEEAVQALEDRGEDAVALAGGTALITMLDRGLLRPGYVVDLGGLSELRGISVGYRDARPELWIGALTPIASLHRQIDTQGNLGLLAEAASQVAHIRVRTQATVGGSVCYAEPQTDLPPALIALRATARIRGSKGDRSIPVEEFLRGPYETVLEPGELLAGVTVPQPPERSAGCHVKFTIGSPANKPVANVSCLVRLDAAGERVEEARVVVGAAGPVAARSAEAEAVLNGERPEEGTIAEAARRAAAAVDAIDDLRAPAWYKRRMVEVLVERCVACSAERARERTLRQAQDERA